MQAHSSLRTAALNCPVDNPPLQIQIQLRTYYGSHLLVDLSDLMTQLKYHSHFIDEEADA